MTPKRTYLQAILGSWQIVGLALGLGLIVAILSAALFFRAKAVMEGQLKDRLTAIASVAAMQFDGAQIEELNILKAKESPFYKQTVDSLFQLKKSIPDIHFAYILRPSQNPDVMEFVADGDAALTSRELDDNKNGKVDVNEETSYPGDLYPLSQAPKMRLGLEYPTTDDHIVVDQWGPYMSGYAPIRRKEDGAVVGVLGIDMKAHEFIVGSEMILSPLVLILLIISTCTLTAYTVFYFSERRVEEWERIDRERAGLMLLTFHQLGGPLTIFKWSLETLLTRTPDQSVDALINDHAVSMKEGITRMDQIINDLHLAAQVQEGHVEVNPKECRIDDLLRSSVDDVREIAEHKGIALAFDVTPELRGVIDGHILQSVSYQLLSNALAFTPRNGHVSFSSSVQGSTIVTKVTDNGSGIPAHDLERMFEKFFRGSNAARLQPDGNGLGLFIAKGLTEAAGGRMWLKSTEGKGTTVTFSLPFKKA